MSYLVGVTMRIVNNESYYEVRDCISNDYIEFLNKFNIVPILISNCLKNPVKFFKDTGCRGLILTGGEDIIISKKDVTNEFIDFKNNRDETEYKLLEFCVKNNIPVLGICRGMQMINIYFNGKVEHLNIKLENGTHTNKSHNIDIIDENFILTDIEKLQVNSYHNNGVFLNNMSKELQCFAISEDNVVEGLHYKKNIMGIQWHPERGTTEFDEFIVGKWISWIGGEYK